MRIHQIPFRRYFSKKCISSFSIFVMLIIFQNAYSQTKMTRGEYIEKYKVIAIQEMVEFNIPASITLAQGIVESGNGNSRLAREANNHFGIKCHTGWEGDFVRENDDAPNECFRKYKDPLESYKDHSFFLSQRSRYASLFELEITNYKAWARGLKKAGYATNPKYANMLIKIIEENNLQKYDLMGGDYVAVNPYPNEIPEGENRKYEVYGVVGNDRKAFLNNGKRFIFARKGDDFYKIANDLNVYNFQIWKYNDLSKNDKLKEGEKVYIEKKRNKSNTEKYHYVKPGETMRSISQLYGIRLSKLYSNNRMKKGTSPRTGQMLWLQSKKPKK